MGLLNVPMNYNHHIYCKYNLSYVVLWLSIKRLCVTYMVLCTYQKWVLSVKNLPEELMDLLGAIGLMCCHSLNMDWI